MKLRLLPSLSLFALALRTAHAQSADDFFHAGAQSYLTNNLATARQEVDKGLKLFPDDIKLKKLDELLKQQQKQQSQQNQQQQQNQKQNSSQQQSQNQKSSEQEQQKEQSQDEKEQNQSKQQQAGQKPDQQTSADQREGQQAKAGEMTPQEARQLLDSQKNNEMLLPASNKQRPPGQQRSIRDW